jgi:hypothetical protein
MKKMVKEYIINDIEAKVIVEIEKRQKDVLDWMDQYTDQMNEEWFDASEDVFQILYKDGTIDVIDINYDGHKVRRNNIASIVYNNACTSIIYGSYEINEYGVVNVAEETKVAEWNITEAR